MDQEVRAGLHYARRLDVRVRKRVAQEPRSLPRRAGRQCRRSGVRGRRRVHRATNRDGRAAAHPRVSLSAEQLVHRVPGRPHGARARTSQPASTANSARKRATPCAPMPTRPRSTRCRKRATRPPVSPTKPCTSCSPRWRRWPTRSLSRRSSSSRSCCPSPTSPVSSRRTKPPSAPAPNSCWKPSPADASRS